MVTALKNNYNSEVLTINCSEDNLVIDDLVFLSSTNKPFIIIMDGYPLAECFMNRFTKNVIEVRFSAENQSEAVQRIIAVIQGLYCVYILPADPLQRMRYRKHNSVPKTQEAE